MLSEGNLLVQLLTSDGRLWAEEEKVPALEGSDGVTWH
jgi:hypothetical protein